MAGDVLVRLFHQPTTEVQQFMRSLPMFRVAFHTNFVTNFYLDLTFADLDGATTGPLRDKRFVVCLCMLLLCGVW